MNYIHLIFTLVFGISAALGAAEPTASDTKLTSAEIYEAKSLIEAQLRAILKGEMSKAYFVYTSSTFRQATSLESFTQFVTTYRDYWRNTQMDWDNATKEKGNLIKMKGFLTFQSQKIEVTYFLMNDLGRWKILGLHLTPAARPDPNLPQPAPESV